MGIQDSQRSSTIAAVILALLGVMPNPLLATELIRILSQNMNQMFDHIDDGLEEKITSPARFRQKVRSSAKNFAKQYGLPQIIALQEVENLRVLRYLAVEIGKKYRVEYRPVLLPGQDISGINVGYLLRSDLQIKQVEQLFVDHVMPTSSYPLFSRPPLYLQVCKGQRCLSILNLHLRSMRGINSKRDGERVRLKRKKQAETIAAWSNSFQHDRRGEKLILLGDLNALTPSDSHVDVIGTLRGDPDQHSPQLRSQDLIDPDLIDLTRSIPENKRYSFIYKRKKQQLDYLLVNSDSGLDLESIRFGSIDYRLSDHAGLLAEFNW
jgi:endonuclease/exonuclease/phosphatase family metal-dependent hydrolase